MLGLLFLFFFLACTNSQSFAPQSFPERPYQLWMPDNTHSKPLPLVVLLHAYDTTPAVQERFFRIQTELRKAGFAYAWPKGKSSRTGQLHWNANASCCAQDGQPSDDSAYVLAVVDDIAQRIPLDKTRVMLVGLSNGAFMAYQLACEAPERFSKLVAVAGAPPTSCPALSSSGPSVLHVHGDSDTLVPLEGGKFDAMASSFPSAASMLELWAKEGACEPIESANPPSLFRQPTTQKAWVCPKQRRHLTLWVVDGGEHRLEPTPAFSQAVLHFLNAP
ncbi:MAG: prolyl oligopeptidase family serine peptidase [Cystobacterineae bacterium]|nr:prolyl oligopeptidase family serine peptidase [Cystobacterineae bacterium]